jgi:PKHD-type hydroxylase
MILVIQNVLTPDNIVQIRAKLETMKWVDGTATAGWHAKLVKKNLQVDRTQPDFAPLNKAVTEALMRNPTFRMAARPKAITPLLFSRYRDEMEYGTHVDDPVIANIRTDISFTIFLSETQDYDGGELVMETTAGEQTFKPSAGQMIIYPSTTLHRVQPVTRGERWAAVGWSQSQIRDANQREILFDLDTARRGLFDKHGKTREFDIMSKAHANLMRLWADV